MENFPTNKIAWTPPPPPPVLPNGVAREFLVSMGGAIMVGDLKMRGKSKYINY